HELRQLRGAEELTNSSGSRLRIDQILRHDRIDLDRGHTLLDRALHTKQPDAVLVLHQFANRANTTVAKVVNVVDLALAVTQFDKRLDHGKDVFLAQYTNSVFCILLEAHVHLDTADSRKIVALRIEEQRITHRFRGVDGGRLARTHHAVDVEQRILTVLVLVDRERITDVPTDIDVVDVENLDLVMAELDQLDQVALALAGLGVNGNFKLVTSLEINLTGLVVNNILSKVSPDQILVGSLDRLQPLYGKQPGLAGSDLTTSLDHNLAGISVNEVVDGLET